MTAVIDEPSRTSRRDPPVAWLRGPAGRPFTLDDLDATPYDGRRYELVDGAMLVTPSPLMHHQHVAFELAIRLRAACPDDLQVVFGPVDVAVEPTRNLAPDVLVVAAGTDPRVRPLRDPPVLVVEVASPSTRRRDRDFKHGLYARFGIPSYWLVDPDVPDVVVCELSGGDRYVETARVTGETPLTVERPFPVTVVPAELVRRLGARR